LINESYGKKNLKKKVHQVTGTETTEPITTTTTTEPESTEPTTTTTTTTEPASTETTEPASTETTKPVKTTEQTTKEVIDQAVAEVIKPEVTDSTSVASTSKKLKGVVEEINREPTVKKEETEKKVKDELMHISNVYNIQEYGNTLRTRNNVEFLKSLDPELEGIEMVYPFEHVDAILQDYYLRSDETCFAEDMDALKEATNMEVYEKLHNCNAGDQEWKISYYALWDRTSTVYENVSMVRGESEVLQDYIMFDVIFFEYFFLFFSFMYTLYFIFI